MCPTGSEIQSTYCSILILEVAPSVIDEITWISSLILVNTLRCLIRDDHLSLSQ